MTTNTTGETVMTPSKPKNNKASKIRKLLRLGKLTQREISIQVGCSLNYVYLINAEMKPKKAKLVPPAELGLASLTPKARPTAEERRVAAYMAYNISQGREVHKFSKERQTDKRHQLVERVAKGVLYVASAGVCVAIAYVFTL